METGLLLVVLGAALLHASWNALAKARLDRRYSVVLVTLASGVVVVPVAPLVAFPSAGAWPWLLASVGLHAGYTLLLTRAYRTGAFSLVYPLARGAAPVFVAAVGSLWLGEVISPPGLAGMALLLAGVALLSALSLGAPAGQRRGAYGYALATALFIAAYTLVDGVGVRLGGTAPGYMVWLSLLEAVLLCAMVAWRKGQRTRLARQFRRDWAWCLLAGVFVVSAYGMVLWAMTQAPIALVAALRETSILFAWFLAVIFLRETPHLRGAVATVIIVTGVILLRGYV